MPSLGDLFVRLGLESSDLEQGAERSKRTLGGLRSEMRSVVNTAGKVAVSAGAVGAALVVGLVDRGAEAAREIRNLSQLAGATTREFQRNAAAARSVGIENAKLADIYKDMNDRVGDFLQTGGGPMADFFEKIAPQVGVTADQFARLSGPESLQLFVDTLDQANLSQAEMTFHMEAIASDSTRLLPLLRNNGEAMRDLGDHAEEMGRVLSDIQLDALDDAKVALDDLRSSMETASTMAAGTFAPAIQAIAEGLSEQLAESFDDSGDDIVNWGETFGTILAFTADAANAATGTIGAAFATLGKNIGANASILLAVLRGEFGEAVQIGREFASDTADIWSDLANNSDFDRYREKLRDLRTEHEERTRAADEAAAAEGRSTGSAATTGGPALEPVTVGASSREVMRSLDEVFRKQAARRRRHAEDQLAQVEEFLMSEQELLTEAHETRLSQLEEALEAEALTEQEYRERREELEAGHIDKLNEMRRRGLSEAERFEEMSAQNKLKTVLGSMTQMTAGVASESKKMFELNKVAALSEAAVSLPSAVLKSFENAGGYPWGIAPAGLMAAAGYKQIQAIQSASFGGGAAASVAGSTAAPPVSDVGGGGQGGGGRQTIFVEGVSEDQLFGGGQIRSLLERIEEAQDDGARIRLSG